MAKVVVVGAGIIGASISKHLAERGAKVTVLEAAAAPAQLATGKSWAWLNANFKQPAHYRDLNLQSMQLWQQNHSDLATFCGSLMLHDERPDPQDPAYPIQAVSAAQLLELEPNLNPGLSQTATHARLFPLEGWCDPVQATERFLAEAQRHGAEVLFEQQVEAVHLADGEATAVHTRTMSGLLQQQEQQQEVQSFPAHAVVLAAGVGTPTLAKQLDFELPLLHKPAAIVLTQPVQLGLLRHMVITDTVFILQRKDGRVLIGETHPEPASNTDTSTASAERVLGLAAAAVPALRSATVEGVYVGYRPFPADSYPVLGWIHSSNVYVAVTHSGMTLAPLIGQLVAEEVMAKLTNSAIPSSNSELLAPYRPSRKMEVADPANDVRWAEAMKQQTR